MGIGIDGNLASVIPLRHLNRATNGVGSALERLSSGRRINRAADDAAGLSLEQRLAAFEAAVQQGSRNLDDGVSALRVADGALSETSENVQRMRELSVQAQNGTLSDDQRAALQQEYDALAEEVTRVSQNTDFNGQNLLDGSTSTQPLRLEDGTGSASQVEISIEEQSAQSLGLSGRDVSDPGTLDAIDQALQSVNGTRASIGTMENRLHSQMRSLSIARENVASARSRIGDADIAVEQANLIKNQLLQAAGIAVRAQGAVHSAVALKLIG